MRGGDDACMPCHHIRPASCVLIDVGQLGRPSRPCVCWAVFDLMTMVEWSVTERSMTIMLCESPAYAQNEGSIHTRLRSVSVIMWLYACTVDGLHAMPPLVACFMRVAFAGEVLDLIIGLMVLLCGSHACAQKCGDQRMSLSGRGLELTEAGSLRSRSMPGINHACIGCPSVPLQQALWLWSWCAAYMRMTVPVASLKACMAGSSCCRPN